VKKSESGQKRETREREVGVRENQRERERERVRGYMRKRKGGERVTQEGRKRGKGVTKAREEGGKQREERNEDMNTGLAFGILGTLDTRIGNKLHFTHDLGITSRWRQQTWGE
jgi:hypothetical protein